MIDVRHAPAAELLLPLVPDADRDAGHVVARHAVTDEGVETGIHGCDASRATVTAWSP